MGERESLTFVGSHTHYVDSRKRADVRCVDGGINEMDERGDRTDGDVWLDRQCTSSPAMSRPQERVTPWGGGERRRRDGGHGK
jgi:hypothetical protein